MIDDSTLYLLSIVEVCQKIFPCQSKLLTHLNSHKSFPCSHCEEVSETYQQYRSHLETHTLSDPIEHSDSIDKQYPQTRGQLVQYILEQELKNNETKEFIVPTRATSTSYPCEICHVIFRKKTLLRAHKLTSHGIAEFRCGKLSLKEQLTPLRSMPENF